MNGICKIGKDICNRFTGYKGKIKNAIADSVKTQLSSTQVKDKMASATKQGLSSLNLPPIKSVKMEGGFVKVTY